MRGLAERKVEDFDVEPRVGARESTILGMFLPPRQHPRERYIDD